MIEFKKSSPKEQKGGIFIKRLIFATCLLFVIAQYIPTAPTKTAQATQQEEIQIIIEQEQEQQEETKEEQATKYSSRCVELVKKYEGLRKNAYICEEDNEKEKYFTIGYGHHTKTIKANDTVTEEQATALLIEDLDKANEIVLKHCEYLELNQNELDCLVSFTFNGGYKMLKQLTANGTRTKEEMAEHITAYTNGGIKGLQRRRQEEKNLFLGA